MRLAISCFSCITFSSRSEHITAIHFPFPTEALPFLCDPRNTYHFNCQSVLLKWDATLWSWWEARYQIFLAPVHSHCGHSLTHQSLLNRPSMTDSTLMMMSSTCSSSFFLPSCSAHFFSIRRGKSRAWHRDFLTWLTLWPLDQTSSHLQHIKR